MSKWRTFSAQFKRDAAALVLDQGCSHVEACRSLGVSVLRRGLNCFKMSARALPEEQSADTWAAENPRTESQDRPAEREKPILKKLPLS